MDQIIERKKWPIRRVVLWSLAGLALVALVFLAFTGGSSTYRTSADRLTISEVIYDDYQEIVAFQGMVEPLHSIQIDASQGGVVEEIFAEDGQQVEEGQPLLRLSNSALSLDFMNRETQIVEQINNLRSTRITLDQNKRQVQEQLIDLDYQLKEQRRQFRIDSSLRADQVISQSDFDASKANLVYLTDRRALMQERLTTDEAYRKSQLHRIDQSIEMMERNLEAIRKNLENLTVRAPITGQLNSFDHEIGETKANGQNLGRIDVLDAYQITAQVDQFYLPRIAVGQMAEIELNGQKHLLEVRKILPTISNGQFAVEFDFFEGPPTDLRRGQTFQVKLILEAKTKSLMLQRGAFFQSSGGRFVYVLSNEGEAFKREVEFGSQNPEYIQILAGLNKGEKVITSSYQGFGDVDRIVIE